MGLFVALDKQNQHDKIALSGNFLILFMQNIQNTTCQYTDPLTYDGDPPTNHSDAWQYSSSTCETINSATSTDVYMGFTHGEIVITVFVFLIFIFMLYFRIFEKVSSLMIKK